MEALYQKTDFRSTGIFGVVFWSQPGGIGLDIISKWHVLLVGHSTPSWGQGVAIP